MAEETGTGANDTSAVAQTTADALTPPVNDGFNRIDPSVDNVSDIDGIPAKEVVEKTADEQASEAKAAEEKAAADKAEAEKAEMERFDKHPRFQELRQTIKDLQEQVKAATTPKEQADAKATAKDREEKALPYKDITQMSKEEILEWQEDDPVGYAANLQQQILHENREILKAEETEKARKAETEQHQTSIRKTFETYEKENPDFRELWDKGEIQKVMDQNPGIGAIGAHMKMSIDARIKDEVEKARKDEREKVIRNFQAKRDAKVIGDGGSIKGAGGIPEELKDTDKYGGKNSAMALRLSRMRQAAAGG